MKKNKMMRLASGLLVAVLLTTCAIAGTFAKYTDKVEGTDAAKVAKFTVDSTVDEIDIFAASKIYDTKEVDYENPVKDTDVKNVDGAEVGLIAPGTWGEFTFVVTDDSEVTVNYAIDYTVDEAGLPLLWSVDGGATWQEDLTDVDATVLNQSADIQVMWKWVYEGGTTTDAQDTAFGTADEKAQPSVKIEVTFTQVD